MTLVRFANYLPDPATYEREKPSLKEVYDLLNADHLIIPTKSEGQKEIGFLEKRVIIRPSAEVVPGPLQ